MKVIKRLTGSVQVQKAVRNFVYSGVTIVSLLMIRLIGRAMPSVT